MSILTPQVFLSYARKDADFVRRLRADLLSSRLHCWMDDTGIQVGDRLNPVIEEAIYGSSLFFAYITMAYLDSRWCMKELRLALRAPGVTVVPYADSMDTLEAVPSELMDEVSFGVLEPETYVRSLLELTGRAWASLQSSERVVPSENHILAGPAIFDSGGYGRRELIERTQKELVLAGPNLRSWLSDDDSKLGLVDLVKRRGIQVTLILATYETLSPISPEGAIHLRHSVKDIRAMIGMLSTEEQRIMSVYFHVGAATLSAVFIDPKTPEGILFFSPRWAIQFFPQDRLTCVIDKRINSEDLFRALYNSVLLMTQGDAKTIEDMPVDS